MRTWGELKVGAVARVLPNGEGPRFVRVSRETTHSSVMGECVKVVYLDDSERGTYFEGDAGEIPVDQVCFPLLGLDGLLSTEAA